MALSFESLIPCLRVGFRVYSIRFEKTTSVLFFLVGHDFVSPPGASFAEHDLSLCAAFHDSLNAEAFQLLWCS